jgi:hypothetical protein
MFIDSQILVCDGAFLDPPMMESFTASVSTVLKFGGGRWLRWLPAKQNKRFF